MPLTLIGLVVQNPRDPEQSGVGQKINPDRCASQPISIETQAAVKVLVEHSMFIHVGDIT